jgi:hypothetical protein
MKGCGPDEETKGNNVVIPRRACDHPIINNRLTMTDIEIAIETKEVVTITNENRVSNDRIVQGHKVVDIEVGRPTDKLYPFFYHCKSLCSCLYIICVTKMKMNINYILFF